jgi:acetyl-CoA C-acetyltransferase
MYITGAGRTKFGKMEISLEELAYEAIFSATKDSGLSISDIDAIYVSNFLGGPINGQLHLNSMISSLIPGCNIPIIRVETACASSSSALNQAVLALSKFSNILILGVEKLSGPCKVPQIDAIAMAEDKTIDKDNGLIFPAAYALIAQQYFNRYGVTHDTLEQVSYINHKNANLNPLAQFYEKVVTREMIKNSKMVASPLNLFDCSPLSDGAAAVVISNKRRSDRDIKILSSQIRTDTISITERKDLTTFKATRLAAQEAYLESGLSPEKIDIFEVHDCFTISELIAIEDLGICGPGKARHLIENDDISLNGQYPVNTDGGLKANGHPIGATGLAQIYEIVTQIRGEAGKRQVADVDYGLAQNIGGIGGTAGITILGAI